MNKSSRHIALNALEDKRAVEKRLQERSESDRERVAELQRQEQAGIDSYVLAMSPLPDWFPSVEFTVEDHIRVNGKVVATVYRDTEDTRSFFILRLVTEGGESSMIVKWAPHKGWTEPLSRHEQEFGNHSNWYGVPVTELVELGEVIEKHDEEWRKRVAETHRPQGMTD